MIRRGTRFVGIGLSYLACLLPLAGADGQEPVEQPHELGFFPGFERSILQSGTQVAKVELAAPAEPEFILRATVPIPPGLYPRPDGSEIFSVLGRSGELIPAEASQRPCSGSSFSPTRR